MRNFTMKIIFSLFITLLCFKANGQDVYGEIKGKVKTLNGGNITNVKIKALNVKANPTKSDESGDFSINVLEKEKVGTSVTLEVSHPLYVLIHRESGGYTRVDETKATPKNVISKPNQASFLTFFMVSKSEIEKKGERPVIKTTEIAEKRYQESEKKTDAESKQTAYAYKQNKNQFIEYTKKINVEIQSEDISIKSTTYQSAYNAIYNQGNFDEAFRLLSDAYIDANLNNAKDKYRLAGGDEAKKKIAKAELEKAVSDCVLKARLYVFTLDYDKAVDYYRKAVFANQDDSLLRDEFANFLNLIGKGYKDTYEFDKAKRAFQEGIDIREKLTKEDSGNEEYHYFKLIEAQNNLIILFREFNQMNEAIEMLTDIVNTAAKYEAFNQRELETPDPDKKKKKQEKQEKEVVNHFKQNENEQLILLSQVFNNIGSINTLQKKYPEAKESFEKALEVFDELKLRPDTQKNPVYLELAQTCTNLGILYTEWYRSKNLVEWQDEEIDAPMWFEFSNKYYDLITDETSVLIKAGKANNYHQWAKMYHRIWQKNPNNKTYGENYFRKVDATYEELSKINPKMFIPRRIKVLCDMFDFYITTKQELLANVTVFNKLSKLYDENKNNVNMSAFTPEIADVTNHLGWIYHNKAKEEGLLRLNTVFMKESKASFQQSMQEYERLNRKNDNIFLPKKAYCYINLSYYYFSLHYAEPLNETKRIGLEYARKAQEDLDKYFIYFKTQSRSKYRDYEAEQYEEYCIDIIRAFEKFSVTSKQLPQIMSFNINYPK